MVTAFILGLLPDGEAYYTDTAKPIEAQKLDAMEWFLRSNDLLSIHAVVGAQVTDISAAFCRMWITKADLSHIEEESDFPQLVRDLVPELVSEVVTAWEEEARGQSQLRSDYYASAL